MSMEDYKKPCGCWGKVQSRDPFIYDEQPCEGHAAAAMANIELKLTKAKLGKAMKVVEAARSAWVFEQDGKLTDHVNYEDDKPGWWNDIKDARWVKVKMVRLEDFEDLKK
jgi:hypothetical protein